MEQRYPKRPDTENNSKTKQGNIQSGTGIMHVLVSIGNRIWSTKKSDMFVWNTRPQHEDRMQGHMVRQRRRKVAEPRDGLALHPGAILSIVYEDSIKAKLMTMS